MKYIDCCHPCDQVFATECSTVQLAEVVCRRVSSSDHQVGQPVAADWQVSVTLQARPGNAATEKSRSRQIVSSKLQTDLLSGDHIQDTGETGAVTSATTPAQFT